jgi:hypothetical protein
VDLPVIESVQDRSRIVEFGVDKNLSIGVNDAYWPIWVHTRVEASHVSRP